MYSINSMHGYNFIQTTSKRLLQAPPASSSSAAPTPTPAASPIYMTGNGLAGFFSIFLLIVPILFVVGFMNSVFVNTKIVEKPLLVGKVDN